MPKTKREPITERLKLTDAELIELQRAASRTWDTIGSDCLRAIEDCGEARRGQAVMKQAAVIEVVLDADYIRMYNPGLGENVKRALREGRYEDLIEAIKPCFPYASYGW